MKQTENRHSLWVINPVILQSEEKYIYGTDTESSEIFFWFLSKRIRVDGFIDEKLKSGKIWNKPVYGEEKLNDREILLILPKEKKVKKGNCCISMDIFVLNPECARFNIFIYGAGKVGTLLLEKLTKAGIKVLGFIDSDREKEGQKISDKIIFGKEILNRITADQAVVEAGKYCEEIDSTIVEKRCDIQRFYSKFEKESEPSLELKIVIDSEKKVFLSARTILLLTNLPCDKNYVLWGQDSELLYKYYEILELLGFENMCIVSDLKLDYMKNIKRISAIEDVLYEEDFWVLICDEAKTWYADKLQVLGLENGRNYAFIYSPQMVCKDKDKKQILDINLGYTIKMNCQYPGFWLFGKNKSSDYKIVVLGGSTSEVDNYWFKSWSEIFYELYCGEGITMINGAVSGYNSAQELIKMIRDVVYLKPDMVIVYDGVNDINRFENRKTNLFNFMYLRSILYKLSGKVIKGGHSLVQTKIGSDVEIWEGIECQNDTFADEWLMNINCMKSVADMHSIKFYSFVQPMLFSKKSPSTLHEASLMKMNEIAYEGNLYKESCIDFRQKGKINAEKYDYIYDLSGIFDEDDVYIDDCHVYEYGNRIIANKIFEVVKNDLPNNIR